MTLEIVVVENRGAALETLTDLIARLPTDTVWNLCELFCEAFRDDLADSPPPMLHVHSGELEPMPFRAAVLDVGADNLGMFQP